MAASSTSAPNPFWLSKVFDVLLDVSRMERALVAVRENTTPTKNMNRLERSCASSRLPDVAKESTYGVAPFLSNVIAALVSWTVAALQDAQNGIVS